MSLWRNTLGSDSSQLVMTSSRIRNALVNYGDRPVVEAAGGQWQLTGAQLLGAAALLLKALEPHANRPLIAYFRKSPLSYMFTACSFLNRLDFCPLDIENPIQRVLDVAGQLAGSLILCDSNEVFGSIARAHAALS